MEKTKDDIDGDVTEDDVIDAVSDATIDDDDDVPKNLFKTDHQNVLLPDLNTSKPVQSGFKSIHANFIIFAVATLMVWILNCF